MALNFNVTFVPAANSKLTPLIALKNPQQFRGVSLRLVVELAGTDGELVYETRDGVTIQRHGHTVTFDGSALNINNVLSTLRFVSRTVDPTIGILTLYSRIRGSESILDYVDSGEIVFSPRGPDADPRASILDFSVNWKTPIGGILDTDGTEIIWTGGGETIHFTVEAKLSATINGIGVANVAGERIVAVPTNIVVNDVLVNGQSVAFTQSLDLVTIDEPFAPSDIIEVVADAPMRYKRLSGDYRPIGGINEETGEVYGRDIPPMEGIAGGTIIEYPFSIRAESAGASADRTFVVKVPAGSSYVYAPEWIEPVVDPDQDYTFIGSYTRGSPVSFNLRVSDNGKLYLSSTDAPVTDDFAGLPDGVSMSISGVISGTIDPSTIKGDHYFAVDLYDSGNTFIERRQFYLTVTSPSGPLEPLRFIRWTTPAGHLGQYFEGEICHAKVSAYSTTGEPPRYSAASPLPAGIEVNVDTGDLQGVFEHVVEEYTTPFTIRAYIGNNFVDRTFSMTVSPRYVQYDVANAHLRLFGRESEPLKEAYTSVIGENEFFRPNDSYFGRLGEMSIYLIGGLSRAASADPSEGPSVDPNEYGATDYVALAIKNSNFTGPLRVKLGGHKIAYVRNATGAVVYEVLYREVVDPLDKAGGFTINTQGKPVRQTIVHPQNGTLIYPESIKNFRYDLALQVGFNAVDAQNNNTPGLGGPENLPLWMKSPQVANNRNTALGYVPAMVVAYLKPTVGQKVIDRLYQLTANIPPSTETDDPNPLMRGHEVRFNHIYLTHQSYSSGTYFDMWTSFDQNTSFDTNSVEVGKYQRINPKGGN